METCILQKSNTISKMLSPGPELRSLCSPFTTEISQISEPGAADADFTRAGRGDAK